MVSFQCDLTWLYSDPGQTWSRNRAVWMGLLRGWTASGHRCWSPWNL